MASFKNMLKGLLRLPANAMVASSDALPTKIEECLQNSPALQAAIDARLSGHPGANGDRSTLDAEMEALDPFVREGTGPYPYFLEEANKLGIDINEYLEVNMGWGDMTPVMNRMVAPLFTEDSAVCELGPGTGRWSMRFRDRLPNGQLHLVDYSPWFVQFLTEYFQDSPNVQVHSTDGFTLGFAEDESLDLVTSFGTFSMLKTGIILSYARDFMRVLKPGGHFVVEYLDFDAPEGWEWLQTYSQPENATVFTYHTPDMMARIFSSVGFEVLTQERVGLWFEEYPYTMMIGRKPFAS